MSPLLCCRWSGTKCLLKHLSNSSSCLFASDTAQWWHGAVWKHGQYQEQEQCLNGFCYPHDGLDEVQPTLLFLLFLLSRSNGFFAHLQEPMRIDTVLYSKML